jgi:hypothetical protein
MKPVNVEELVRLYGADELHAALRDYRVKHWGAKGREEVTSGRVADPTSGILGTLGELVSVVYQTTKAGDPPRSEYEHEFEQPRPILGYVRRSGLLVIGGGNYRVSVRGIVG